MFYYISGIVAHLEKNVAVIDCGGVGYLCRTSQTTLSQLKEGKKTKLYTYVHVREDAFDVYGFLDRAELACFQQLIGISGVGPKAGLSILSVAPFSQLALAIITGDEKLLTQAQGIGKKTAQRIVLELRDKMSDDQLTAYARDTSGGFASAIDRGSESAQEAVAALTTLGYSQMEAMQAMDKMDVTDLSAEEIIKQCLKRLFK